MLKPYFLLALFAISAVAFVGCDSNDEEDDVFGLWFTDEIDGESGDVYFDVSADEIVTYFLIEDPENPDFEPCYFIESVDVVSRDDDEWVIENGDGDEFDATIRRDGDELVVTSEGDTIRFERSSVDVDTLTPECPDGERQPQGLMR